MATVSYQVLRDGLDAESGPAFVTQGTAAPTTSKAIEVRVDLAAGWTKKELELKLCQIVRYVWDTQNGDTTGAFIL